MQQEGSAATTQAQGAAQPYVEQAKQTLNNAGNVAASYATAAQETLSNATSGTTTSGTTTTTGTTTGQTGPTYVEQAKGLAAATANTAQSYAAGAATVAGDYANMARVSLPFFRLYVTCS